AEDARAAAAKAAADQAAAAQAAADQAAAAKAATARTTTARTTTATRTATSSGGSVAAAAPAAATVGVEYSAGTVGAALNAFRASRGLPPMAIVRSAARVEHAQEMAASNSIWHSSVRTMWEIVGRVMPVSATAMIDAYANSPSHLAVMVGNFSTAYIGAVTYNGMLYTSIQCG
ncbi:MAG: CAP domain-containing protein, partial [Cellulomonas sp.]